LSNRRSNSAKLNCKSTERPTCDVARAAHARPRRHATVPPYTNVEAGLRPMGRAPRPSPCTWRVWVPWMVPRAVCTPATLRRPRAVIGRRPPACRHPVRRTPAMPQPTPRLASTWFPSYHLNRLEPAIKAPPFFTRVSTKPAAVAIAAAGEQLAPLTPVAS
jgi:hypothetical protein